LGTGNTLLDGVEVHAARQRTGDLFLDLFDVVVVQIYLLANRRVPLVACPPVIRRLTAEIRVSSAIRDRRSLDLFYCIQLDHF
jgi:hypothetical protein